MGELDADSTAVPFDLRDDDRPKELIKYKGHQGPPAEIEAVLLTLRKIADAAVIGVIDAESGEEVPKVFVVKQSDAELTEAEVI